MVAMVNNTVLCTWKLLREKNLKGLITRKVCYYVKLCAISKLIWVPISQYIQICNHYVVHLKHAMYYAPLYLNKIGEKSNISTPTLHTTLIYWFFFDKAQRYHHCPLRRRFIYASVRVTLPINDQNPTQITLWIEGKFFMDIEVPCRKVKLQKEKEAGRLKEDPELKA